jgi:hypothetical protein
MSLQDVLNLARALPRAEQLQLVEALNETTGDPDDELLRLIPPGFVAEFWHVHTDPEGMELMQRELESFRSRSHFELTSRP